MKQLTRQIPKLRARWASDWGRADRARPSKRFETTAPFTSASPSKLVKWEIDSQTARTQFRDLAGQLFHTRILVLCGDRDGAAGAGESAHPQKAVRGRGSAGSAQVVVSLQ
jgi:ribosomal protein S5